VSSMSPRSKVYVSCFMSSAPRKIEAFDRGLITFFLPRNRGVITWSDINIFVFKQTHIKTVFFSFFYNECVFA